MTEVFEFKIPRWPLIDMTGYKPKTTFWEDFSFADNVDEKAVRETFDRAFKEWKDDKVYATELSMVLNWKQFQFAKDGYLCDNDMCRTYMELWKKIDEYIVNNWKGEKLSYYLKETD